MDRFRDKMDFCRIRRTFTGVTISCYPSEDCEIPSTASIPISPPHQSSQDYSIGVLGRTKADRLLCILDLFPGTIFSDSAVGASP